MSLKLGKSFDRNYTIRIPFLNNFQDISIFFNKKSTFLLFGVEHNSKEDLGSGVKINMFKNLESSKFCESFLELHNYRKNTLDILNQFKAVRPEYSHEISFLLNESVTLAKVDIEEENGKRSLFDCLNIYGFTMNSYQNEFVFIITERQNIVTKFNKKIVRTSGIQLATSHSLEMLDEYHEDSKKGKIYKEVRIPSEEKIKLM